MLRAHLKIFAFAFAWHVVLTVVLSFVAHAAKWDKGGYMPLFILANPGLVQFLYVPFIIFVMARNKRPDDMKRWLVHAAILLMINGTCLAVVMV